MTVDPAAGTPRSPAAAESTAVPIESLVRNLAAVTAIFYVCGFLTTNAYLYRLGVSDFSILRTRFILTGALVLTPLLQGIIWGIYAAVDLDVFSSGRRLSRRGYVFVLGDIGLLFVLYFGLFAFVADSDLLTSARQAALLSLLCAFVVLALLGSLVYYRASERRPVSRMLYRGQPRSDERIARRFGVHDVVIETISVAVFVVILLLTYLTIFGDRFYASFPEQVGGGRPRTVQLMMSADAIPAARQLGLDIGDGDQLSEPVELLWVGEESYVVRLPPPRQQSVVQIGGGLVGGVVTGRTVESAGADAAP